MRFVISALILFVALSALAQDPAACKISDIYAGAVEYRQPIRTQGVIVDAFADEIDHDWAFFLIKDCEHFLPVAIPRKSLADVKALSDAVVSVTGTCFTALGYDGCRRFSGPFVRIQDFSTVSVLQPAPADPFAVPELENPLNANPLQIAQMGKRKIAGTVLASWGDDASLIRLEDGRVIRIGMADGIAPPPPGAIVAAAGYPSTDQFHIRLRRVSWKRLSDQVRPFDEPEEIPPKTLITRKDAAGLNVQFYGHAIHLTGIVRTVPGPNDSRGRMTIEADGYVIAVDRGIAATAFSDIRRGCTVSVTGIALIEAADWQPYEVFPRLGEYTLILRRPSDIRVTANPPWLTVSKLLFLSGALLLALVAFLIWNVSLKRLVATRSRQLVREGITAAKAELRAAERTSMAIEIHDALSQNLTGVALEIKTALRTAPHDLQTTLRHLAFAQHSLSACGEELRACLWNLRNDVSGRDRMDETIRTALQPFLDGTQLTVDFDIPRRLFQESTVSVLLRIIRELVVNAIRHGQASSVSVEGRQDGPEISMTVTDNGRGFDPAHAPGLDAGHFGLQGVRERLAKFGGALEIESAPGQGARIRIHFTPPPTSDTATT